MNEQIYKIAKQADALAREIEPNLREIVLYNRIRDEKFAELIVRECVESLWTEECYTSDLALKEFLKNSKKINLHFGVEE